MITQKITIVGANGLLGQALTHSFTQNGWDIAALGSKDIDITNPDSIKQALDGLGERHWVFNCAAFTKVDACETHADLAYAVNGYGAGHLARYCAANTMPLVHFSTDYIFDGTKSTPYDETDTACPINVYGKSKALGEHQIIEQTNQHYIFRIQWLYGPNGTHFVDTIRRKFTQQPNELAVVSDQIGSPTYTNILAQELSSLIKKPIPYGVYHLACSGYTSWHGFAQYILKTPHIKTLSTKTINSPAKRPLNSRLNTQKWTDATLRTLPNWQSGVDAYLKDLAQ